MIKFKIQSQNTPRVTGKNLHTDYMTQVVMMHKMGENYYYNCVYVKDISEANSKIAKATQNG